jgi:LmbE family N-acetylglucosaminyl deacetylase
MTKGYLFLMTRGAEKMNVLAIGCHPDDLEIACSGTLAKYVKQGHKVFMCHIANGNLGHAVIMPRELGLIRAKEAEKSAEIIGAEPINIDVDDMNVDSYNKDTLKKVIDVIRYTKPDLIITHNPDDYMKDHMEASRIAFNASFGSSIPHIETDHPSYDDIVPIFYMDTLAGINFIPTEYVDISDMIDLKLQALACHESQIKWMYEHDKIDFLDFVKTTSKFRGLQCRSAFAEGFRQCLAWPRVVTQRLLPQ